jgi:hypothetical protein
MGYLEEEGGSVAGGVVELLHVGRRAHTHQSVRRATYDVDLHCVHASPYYYSIWYIITILIIIIII